MEKKTSCGKKVAKVISLEGLNKYPELKLLDMKSLKSVLKRFWGIIRRKNNE